MPFVEGGTLGTTVTGNDIIEEVQRLLMGGQREELNKLAANVSGNATTLTFTFDVGGIREGSLIEIDYETYRVWSIDESTKTAVVEPAMGGSRTASHSAGALVYVNPRLTRGAIFKALNDEISALSAPSNGLYRMKTVEFDYNASQFDYEINATDLIDIYDVRERSIVYPETWHSLDHWTYKQRVDVDTFGSGNGVHVPYATPAAHIQVLYKAAFRRLSDGGENIATAAGIPPEMQDILPYGCLLRLGPVREIKRNFTEAQGDSRRADEVPPGAVANSFSYVRAQRQQRIDQEAQRLALLYPERRR